VNSKIRIKLGAIEVEYEGSENFLKEELPALLQAVSDLYAKSSGTLAPPEGESRSSTGEKGNNGTGIIEMTTASIASKLGVRSGPELVLAAAAHLRFVKGAEKFPRKQLIEQMRSASSFFKESYVSNLSKTIKVLMKENKFNEPSSEVYALNHTTEQELRSRLV